MKRIFTLMLGALAMLTVALISAFIAMRLAIHGREVEVPALTGLSIADAATLASHDSLNLTLENRFYSADVPAGRVLAQSPMPGSRVRRDWAVRITESLGAQHVSIPDLTGQSERAASIAIRRLALDQGVVAHLAVDGDPDVVLAQTPTATSAGVTGPRVSLLVSDPVESEPQLAWVMPSLTGLSLAAATARVTSMGLRVAQLMPSTTSPDTIQPEPVSNPSGVIAGQYPAAGHRVTRGDVVRLSIGPPRAAAVAVPSATP
jgi:beta-lactam-binding protein with PASTA domain